ncbi:MAG: hypothetical protein A2600_09870 [Candidatus Lambdaproteobacteria bacterium RIFOXYD1_FULL_56_27]|uniref:Type-F conjugative transfer system protein TraW n=1 Tax=Candidatus Lambdaproteobacteria bacterium RIFOXYD2_FULL_56_26 TaxID=1817773 RepID=A0A1F6GU57_9PROT|nr:MAG: hypothetical protein A2557_11820 [Candidatus Lambdaproteobacteria bacterium RIFOXYD2_FULL_56_26]OGH04324.1 MAG: hypothetical protein A2426_05725 [Candidatus Lambdaproteobacteria bacterium RIFOXYC1_FULL_56_13]OGH07386.1 MAG: hypothetical protein A2600_09870 [Candidatus Lambdaproteobacteria bacterium RIFOXYD1_FULL_56_27]
MHPNLRLFLGLIFALLPWWTVLAVYLYPQVIFGEEVETVGKTYPIIEQDMIERIHEEVEKGTWKKDLEPKKLRKKLEELKPLDWARLPRATEDRTFTPDLTWELDFEITDAQGKVLYPKGFKFDPSRHLRLQNRYLAFDPSDPAQLEWFEASQYKRDGGLRLMVAGGSMLKLTEAWNRPVYYLPQPVVKRFGIKALPALVEQKGDHVEVKEFKVKGGKK